MFNGHTAQMKGLFVAGGFCAFLDLSAIPAELPKSGWHGAAEEKPLWLSAWVENNGEQAGKGGGLWLGGTEHSGSSYPSWGFAFPMTSAFPGSTAGIVAATAANTPGHTGTTFLSSFISGSGLSVMATYHYSIWCIYYCFKLRFGVVFRLLFNLSAIFCFLSVVLKKPFSNLTFLPQKIRLQGHGYVQFDLAIIFSRTRI